MDIVVTVPKTFTHPAAPGYRGLAAWLREGDAPGEQWDGDEWCFTTHGLTVPDVTIGERVYVVCEDRLVGYAPLVDIGSERTSWGQWRIHLMREGGAVACTIPEKIVGFRGWKYRWWDYAAETPLDLSPWLEAKPVERKARATKKATSVYEPTGQLFA